MSGLPSDTDMDSDDASASSAKRKRPNDTPPDSRILQQSKKVNICGYCSKKCTLRSEAIQCDLCHSWVHASCEGISKQDYELLTQVTGSVENVVYFCKLHSCLTVNKKLLNDHLNTLSSDNADLPSLRSLQTEQLNLHKIISKVSAKIDDLCNSNDNLKQQITTTSETITSASLQSHSVPRPPASSAQDIADELADRERRKSNLIVYNFSESSDDKKHFIDLCNTVFKLDISVVSHRRLGKQAENKLRPLLLSLEDVDDKEFITSRSYLLRRHEEYKNVYISADMTKYQRAKHKQLVEELKRRKAANEPNLTIRNGVIVTKHPYRGNQGNNSQPNSNHQQHSETQN